MGHAPFLPTSASSSPFTYSTKKEEADKKQNSLALTVSKSSANHGALHEAHCRDFINKLKHTNSRMEKASYLAKFSEGIYVLTPHKPAAIKCLSDVTKTFQLCIELFKQKINSSSENSVAVKQELRELTRSISRYLFPLINNEQTRTEIAKLFNEAEVVYSKEIDKNMEAAMTYTKKAIFLLSMVNKDILQCDDVLSKKSAEDVDIKTMSEKFSKLKKEKKIYEELLLSHKVMQLFVSKLLDKTAYYPALTGLDIRESLESMINDIEAFMKQCSDADYKRWECVLNDLKFAKELRDDLSYRSIESIVEKIVQRLGDLPIPAARALLPSLIIPGGYKGKMAGHAVLYQIERQSADKFAVTVINTGEGAPGAPIIKNNKVFVIDKRFSGVTLAQLKACLPQLLKWNAGSDRTGSMDKIYMMLSSTFIGAEEGCGRKHLEQVSGTCSVRCLVSWMYGKMGKDAYRQFHLIMIERTIEAAEKEIKNNIENPIWTKIIFGTNDKEYIGASLKHLMDSAKKLKETALKRIEESKKNQAQRHKEETRKESRLVG
jgi:hypothetical protein